jgi:hypothetical protein
MQAFQHAIYSQGDLKYGGSASTSGDIYTGGDLTITGNPTVHGNVDVTGSITGTSNNIVPENTNDNQPLLIPPTIDLSWYKNKAIQDGTYYTSASDAESAHEGATTNDVVIYIADPLNVTKITSGNTVISGTLIVEGDLNLNNATISLGTGAYDNPLTVYVGGVLKLGGGSGVNNIHGLVYVLGDSNFAGGSNQITGSFFSVNENSTATLDFMGNIQIIYDSNLITSLNDVVGINSAVQVGVWNQL